MKSLAVRRENSKPFISIGPKKGEEYYTDSDNTDPEMDLQDKKDHKCQPTDPVATTTQLPSQR